MSISREDQNILSSEDSVVHEEQVDIIDVADKESLVSGWDQMSCFLVGAVSNLLFKFVSLLSPLTSPFFSFEGWRNTYRWHSGLTLESPPDSIVNTLWLPP
jgi:hypothetical protein